MPVGCDVPQVQPLVNIFSSQTWAGLSASDDASRPPKKEVASEVPFFLEPQEKAKVTLYDIVQAQTKKLPVLKEREGFSFVLDRWIVSGIAISVSFVSLTLEIAGELALRMCDFSCWSTGA